MSFPALDRFGLYLHSICLFFILSLRPWVVPGGVMSLYTVVFGLMKRFVEFAVGMVSI